MIAPHLFSAAYPANESLPRFSGNKSDTRFSELFYALLQTNERTLEFEKELPPVSFSGSFVGIGFGTSIYLLSRHFGSDTSQVYLCEREPYVYLFGKIFLHLLQSCSSAAELLLCFLDYESFKTITKFIAQNEADDHPLFLRCPKEAFLKNYPEELLELRYALFRTQHHKLTHTDRGLFSENSLASPTEKLRWITHFLRYKADLVKSVLVNQFARLQAILAPEHTQLHCVDFFSPKLWDTFASAHDVWQRQSMIYLSNAAIYSLGLSIRKVEFSTSKPYTEKLFENISGASEGRHRFVYSIRGQHYELRSAPHIPNASELLDSFRAAPAERTVDTESPRAVTEVVAEKLPSHSRPTFRLGLLAPARKPKQAGEVAASHLLGSSRSVKL